LPFSAGITRLICFRGAGAGRHDVQRGGAGPSQIPVRAVLQVLVGGVRVDRGHQTLFDPELVVDRLWPSAARQFVVQDAFEMMLVRGRVVVLVVDAHHDRDVLVLGPARR